MKTIKVLTEPEYEVKIRELDPSCGAVSACRAAAAEIASFLKDAAETRLCVITDGTVDGLYGGAFMDELKAAGLDAAKLVFAPGENSKSLTALEEILEFMAAEHYTRNDMLIALGGGVIGDLTGFAAASFLRGVSYIQVPTTLLACVDSSVGGKTAINLKAGKNLAGAFWQPRLVVINENFLTTLSRPQQLDGLAEVIKCGLIGDKELFDHLRGRGEIMTAETMTYAITHAVTLKSKVVAEDEKDNGSRQLLNLGHTLGHAIEGASRLTVPHGHAVASGMYLTARAAYRLGWTKEDLSVPIGALLKDLGYTLVYPYSKDELMKYLLSDKKRRGSSLTLVISEEIGRSVLKTIPVSEVEAFVDAALKEEEAAR